MLPKLDLPISFKEIDPAVNKFKNGKSPGLNGIPPEAYMVMNRPTHCRIHCYVAAFFVGNADYLGWHQSQCVPVPKKEIFMTQTNGAG